MQDKYLRSVANFRNLQNITKRDIQTARDYAITKFATDLIESVDNFDRALATVPSTSSSNDENGSSSSSSSNKELQSLYDGLKMTEKILMQTLKKHGLERFDPSQHPGTKFDPALHEATFQTKAEGKADGDVIMVQQKGFMLNGRVLRVSFFRPPPCPYSFFNAFLLHVLLLCESDRESMYVCVYGLIIGYSHYRLQRLVLRRTHKEKKKKEKKGVGEKRGALSSPPPPSTQTRDDSQRENM